MAPNNYLEPVCQCICVTTDNSSRVCTETPLSHRLATFCDANTSTSGALFPAPHTYRLFIGDLTFCYHRTFYSACTAARLFFCDAWPCVDCLLWSRSACLSSYFEVTCSSHWGESAFLLPRRFSSTVVAGVVFFCRPLRCIFSSPSNRLLRSLHSGFLTVLLLLLVGALVIAAVVLAAPLRVPVLRSVAWSQVVSAGGSVRLCIIAPLGAALSFRCRFYAEGRVVLRVLRLPSLFISSN